MQNTYSYHLMFSPILPHPYTGTVGHLIFLSYNSNVICSLVMILTDHMPCGGDTPCLYLAPAHSKPDPDTSELPPTFHTGLHSTSSLLNLAR